MTRLNTPFGTPDSCRICVSANAMAGVSDAGFITTVLPNASAGALFQAGIAIGKFQGVIRPTTPSGSRYVDTSMPGRVESTVTPCRRRASPAKNLKMRPARATSPTPSGKVLPSSRERSRPSSSLRARRVEPTRSSTSLRTSGLASAQPGRAVFAACTASSIAAPSSDGARATTSRVSEGFRLSSADLPRTHSPLM